LGSSFRWMLRAGVLRRVLVVFTFFLIAVLGFRLYSSYSTQLTWVPVLTEDIPLGARIATNKIKLVQAPRGLISGDIVRRTEDLNGKYAITLLYKDQPVNRRSISDTQPQSSGYGLPAGHVAFPLTIDGKLKAAQGIVKKGALIDLILVTNTEVEWLQRSPGNVPTTPLLTKVRVLDVVGNVWVLDLTPDQANALAAITASNPPIHAIITDPANPDLNAIYGKGGEAR
jgi:Flp pilus assembly protein CpaB